MYQVLIVDNEPISKITLRSMVDWEMLGFQICATSTSSEEALEMVKHFHPDLVICELKMPVMDGFSLMQEIKKLEIPCEFLIISNCENFNYMKTALRLGAMDYLIKSDINPSELTRQLQNIWTILEQQTQKKLPQTESSLYSPEITKAISYIKTHYQHKISLPSISEHVGLSSGYLCYIFKKETGLSINTYINQLRMNKAGELLMDKNSYIKEVAAAVGIEDQLYFSRLFKRYYGITPSEYRLNE